MKRAQKKHSVLQDSSESIQGFFTVRLTCQNAFKIWIFRPKAWTKLAYVWTSLRWCISRGPMKTGLSPVSWCTSFKLRYVVVVRHVFSENVESGISAKYSEFLLVSAEWLHLFKLAWMSQDTCTLRMDLNSTYEFRIPSPFLLPFGLFKEDP